MIGNIIILAPHPLALGCAANGVVRNRETVAPTTAKMMLRGIVRSICSLEVPVNLVSNVIKTVNANFDLHQTTADRECESGEWGNSPVYSVSAGINSVHAVPLRPET